LDGSPSLIFIWLALLVGVMYFLMIRPQQKRVASHRRLVDSLQLGDMVVTIGGIHGELKSIGDEKVEIEVASDSVLTFSKSAVAGKLDEGDAS